MVECPLLYVGLNVAELYLNETHIFELLVSIRFLIWQKESIGRVQALGSVPVAESILISSSSFMNPLTMAQTTALPRMELLASKSS